MSFAQLNARSKWVDGHVVLARRLEQPRFRKIQTISLRNHVHHFRLTSAKEMDEQVVSWLRRLMRLENNGISRNRHTAFAPEKVNRHAGQHDEDPDS
jgi:hypothetical protein